MYIGSNALYGSLSSQTRLYREKDVYGCIDVDILLYFPPLVVSGSDSMRLAFVRSQLCLSNPPCFA